MSRINSQKVSCQLSDVSCQKGFSLLELLIYIALLSIVTLIFAGTFISIDRGRGNIDASSEVDSNLRFAMEKITNDIRSATAVSTPTASSTSITLVLTVSGASTTYDVSGGQLRRQVGAGAQEPITATTVTVSAPTFTRLDNTNTYLSKTIISIKVDLTMSYNSASPDYQYSQRKISTASLR